MKLRENFNVLIFLFISINTFSQSYVYTGRVVSISGTHMVTPLSTTYGSDTISGEYLTILGRGHTSIVNPFIIIEGIDFLNDQDFDTHLNLYNSGSNSLIFNLYDNEFDVIILDFDNAIRPKNRVSASFVSLLKYTKPWLA